MDSRTAIQILARMALCIGMSISLFALTFEAASAASQSPAVATKGKGNTSTAQTTTSSDEEDTEDTEDDEDSEDRDDSRRAANLPINGWWWAPSQPGRGYSIEIRRRHLFLGAYTYNSLGQAVWVISSGSMRTATTYRGEFEYHREGPTLEGRAGHLASSASSTSSDRDDDDDDDGGSGSGSGSGSGGGSRTNGSAGIVEITFTSPTTATLTWAGTAIEIERFSIVAGGAATDWDSETPNRPSTGWYWDPSRAGSGFFTEMQGESLFLVAFFYRADGSPVWYVAMQGLVPGSSGSNLVFTGSLYEYASATSGGATASSGSVDVTTPTDTPAAYAFAEVGTVTVQFRQDRRAAITMPSGEVISVRRFRF